MFFNILLIGALLGLGGIILGLYLRYTQGKLK